MLCPQGRARLLRFHSGSFQFIQGLESYFGTVDEESIRNNFVLIYELLDEMMDYGYPQNTDADILKLVITQKGVMSEATKGRDISVAATGVVNWRAEGLKYRKNELYIDVVEDVNLLMSKEGTILRSDVAGKVPLPPPCAGLYWRTLHELWPMPLCACVAWCALCRL